MSYDNPPDVKTLPEAPQRGTRPESAFTQLANTFTSGLSPWQQDLEALAAWMRSVGDTVRDDRDTATAARDAAQEAEKAAEGTARLFPDTEDGLEGTIDGEYFSIPSESDTGFIDLYRNNSGSASFQRTSASETIATAAEAAKDDAETARDMAQASANFIGRWADQTGSVAVPASVHHSGAYWALLEDLTDIALEEPGDSGSWSHIFMGGDGLPFGPGPQTLQAGDMQAGFFGEVSSSELFSGDELAYLLGVTEGVPQFSDAGWLKFAHNGKVKFVAKKTLRHSISWDHLYSRGLVYGTDDDGKFPRGTATNQYTTVERAGNTFVCRLLTGANADPFDESDSRFFTDDMCELNIGGASEWNELIYRVHELEPDCPATNHRADRSGGPQEGDNWATFTDSELRVGSGNGRQTWCQERGESSSTRVLRGNSGVAFFARTTASSTPSRRGWRPALILVPNS